MKNIHLFHFSRAIESEEEEEDSSANTIPSEELNTAVRDLTIK